MNKHLQLPVDIERVQHSGQTVLRLSLQRKGLCDWCVGLSLLKEGLIETLTVTEQRGRGTKVQFLKESKVNRAVRVSFHAGRSQVVMTDNSIDYVQHFFLKYYRDGLAEVDHIDLQAVDAETGNSEIYVTFQVAESIPPVTGEEAKRRLGR
jgi:hypothetical protein